MLLSENKKLKKYYPLQVFKYWILGYHEEKRDGKDGGTGESKDVFVCSTCTVRTQSVSICKADINTNTESSRLE